MSVIFHFVDDQDCGGQSLQFIQAELCERLKEFSEQIKEDGVFLQSPLKALSQNVIEEVIVGNNCLAFKLDDGRVCRTSFTIKTEKINQKQERVQKRLSKTAVEKLVHFGGSSTQPPRTSLGPTSEASQTKGFISNRSTEASQSVVGGANSVRNSLPHRIARYQMLSSTHSAPRVNFIREMQRQGIYFARTFNTPIAASEVPEDLIEQCQTVLQGKSRQLIIRELQRTNLDVNMAVNNLLSRDDEAEENGGASAPDDWEETDDLLSLLDHAENPLLEAAVTDSSLGIPEDIFPSIRLRRESLYSSMASDIESFADRRKRRRLDCQLRSSVDSLPRSFVDATYTPRSGTDSPTFTTEEPPKVETSLVKKNCLVLGSSLEFWKEKCTNSGKGKDLKFITISGMFSELVGITVDNDLHQWRWSDSEPWSSITAELSTTILQGNSFWNNNLSNGGVFFHPRIPSLNLINEKIIKLDCCSSRATVLTASGKLATWVDETIAPIFQVLRNSDLNYTTQNLKIEHPMTQFCELKDETVLDIYTSSLVSAVRCQSGNIFWWGVIPFKYRKSAMEKNRDRNPRRSMKHDCSVKQNKKEASNINPGSFVCMRNAPIFHSGAIGFTVVGGIPKVGTLLEDAWKIEDICRFSVKPVQTLVNERRNSMPNSAPSINPASFDPLTHAHMCPQINTSFLYGLLGSSNNKTVVNISEGNQNSNDSIIAQCSSNSSMTYKTPTYWAEMPPPPSPASSTCSDQSGPVKISPGTFKRKKHSMSSSGDLISEVNTESRPPILSSNNNRSSKLRSNEPDKLSVTTSTNLDYEPLAGHKRPLTPDDKAGGAGSSLLNQQEEEEDWCLKDVIFLEDGRTQPVGVVLKVDGSIAAVKFLKDSERACVAVNCPYSPLTAVFGTGNQTCTEPSLNSNAPNSPDPISWLNDCRLLRKEELVVVKQPLVSRVPDVVQKYPKCISLESCLDTKVITGSSSSGILGMALENELIHLLVRKKNSSKFIEYKVISLGKKVISSHRLSTPITGFLGKSSDSCLISGPLESDYCELKHGSIFKAERHRPIFVRDGNGTVYPMLFKDTQISNTTSSKSEPILSPHWLDLPPVRCVDFGFVTVSNNNTNNTSKTAVSSNNGSVEAVKSCKSKVSRLLIGVLVLESQTLMHHILRADDKKVAGVLESFSVIGEQDNLIQKIINEKLDGQRNIFHVAVHMCQSVSNVETEWKLGNILSYRSRKSSMVSNVEDLSHRSNWSLEHAANMSSSLSYRRWIDMGRPMSDSAIFNYSRSNDKQPSNVRFTVMSSTTPSRTSYQGSEANAGWFLPPIHLDEKEKRSNSYKIINILVNQPSMDSYLITLLSQRNADGQTPFMQAIAQRVYSVALFFFDCIFDLCNTQYVSVQNPKSEFALNMIYPSASHITNSKSFSNSFFDDSPLQMLCQNDGCSFTWTGPDHIRQDIFECRTCGLTESLCCCTECARVCHKGHDCHLKKTSPTAYCDCWEKCRCKALIVGDSVARQELLKKLLLHTDLSTLPNRRKEHILLFLVKTVDRQFREHKQARNSSRRHATSVLNSRHGSINNVAGLTSSQIGSLDPHHPAFEPPMPEYGLEPSNFALIALDAALSNWASIETLFLLGEKSDWMHNILNMTDKTKEPSGMNPVTDDDAFLNYQSFSEQLDQFVFTLISKTPSSSVDILLKTLNQELQNEKSQCSTIKPNHQTKVKRVASRLIRSVARVYVALQLQMAPDYNRKRQSNRLSNSGHIYSAQSRPLEVCKKIFENLLFISLSELPRIAADIIAPVRCGLLKPTTNFSHLYQIADAVKNLDHVFQTSYCETELTTDPGDVTAQSSTKQSAQTSRTTVPPLSSSRNSSNVTSRTMNNATSTAITESNTSNGIDSSNFHSGSTSNNPSRGYRRRPHNDDDPDGGSGAVAISIDSVNRNSDSAPPTRRRRQSTPISLSSRMNELIAEEEDEDGHSSDEDNWTSNREVRSNSEERQHSNQLNSIYLEESDGDGNTIEGENDIDGDVDMEVYDDDHDTDIVPETESDSDDSINSSICVTEYNSESVVAEASSIPESRTNLAQAMSSADSDIRVKDERSISMSVNTENGSYMTSRECILKSYLDVPLTESMSLRKSSGIYDNEAQEATIIPNDEALRYSISLNIDETRNAAAAANNHLSSLENTLAAASSEITASINNPPEWFGNQVDLDAISDDESDEDSSQNTDDDERDELNESATDLSQTVLHQRTNHTLVHEVNPHADVQGSASTTAPSQASSTSINCGLQTTQAQLARSFCCLIKLLASLLNQMYYSREKTSSNMANNQKEYDRIGLNLGPDIEYSNVGLYASLSQSEEEYILLECSQQLGPIWIWICQSMDFLESQVCFAMAHQRKHGTYKASPVLTFDNMFASSNIPPSIPSQTSSSTSTDSNRYDFLKYVVSMMRASSDEHGDQVPISLFSVNYCHIAYLVDALLYLMRICFGMVTDKICCDGVDPSSPVAVPNATDDPASVDNMKTEPTLVQEEIEEEQEDLNSLRPTIGSECDDSILDEETTCPTLICDYNLSSGPCGSTLLKPQVTHRRDCQQKVDTSEDIFFSRTDYPQGWVGLGANAFQTTVSEALPLAHMPQLLQPPGPSDEVFGVLRRFQVDISDTRANFCGRSNEGQLPLHMGFSSRWADRLLDNNIIFSGVPVGNLRTRWRYSLEFLSNTFEQSVGLEPDSILVNFTHFSLKETRFRKEMEKLRNQCRRDLSLVVNRDRSSIICDTVTQLNAEFSRRNSNNTSTPLICHRFKVKFNDEPGEGNGVARSFLTVFAEAILSDEPLSMNHISIKKVQPNLPSRGSIYSRNEHNYIRMSAISRTSAPSSTNITQSVASLQSSNWQDDALSVLGLGYNPISSVTRNYRPTMRIVPTTQASQPSASNSRSIIRSDLTSTAQRLISAIAIFASSAPVTTTDISNSLVWGISSPSNINNVSSPSVGMTSSYSHYSLDNQAAAALNAYVPEMSDMNYNQFSRSDRGGMNIRVFPRSVPSNISSYVPTNIPFNSTTVNVNPPSYSSIPVQQFRDLPTNSELLSSQSGTLNNNRDVNVTALSQLGNLDALNIASGFTANLGNQAPIWVSSNWLPMSSNAASISSPISSLGNFRRLTPYSSSNVNNNSNNGSSRYFDQNIPNYSNVNPLPNNPQSGPSINLYDMLRSKISQNDPSILQSTASRTGESSTSSLNINNSVTLPTSNVSIYEVLRSKIPGDDSLIQQMAYNLSLISGRSDLNGLLAQLSAKTLNSNDIISNLMNSTAQISRLSMSQQMDSAGPTINIERSPETSQASDINLEVSILTFAIYLESLMSTSNSLGNNIKAQQDDSDMPVDNPINKCPVLEPEQTPLFWQPGHTGFYAPRRVNISDNNFEYARNNVYRSVGRIIGLSLLMNETMPLKLSRHVLKYIVGLPIGWHDFAFYNSQLYESLRQLMQVALEAQQLGIAGSSQDPLLEYNLNFTITPREEEGASVSTTDERKTSSNVINLIPNGEEVDVDSNNVFQYVKKYAITRMIAIVKVQLDQIKFGVYDVLPKNALNGLSPEDLRLLFNGTDDINIDVLMTYTSFLDESSVSISNSQERVTKFKKWFWSVVKGFNAIQRQNLLYFWTSSPSLPASDQGFQPMPSITIRPADDLHLPTANTCISRLYIPLYSSKLILKDKLLQAIETKSFGFV